ncbi:hypothetical protein [Azospirillum sp. SYSU D00513]|uniref:hypothetical protein n=1 Tax=Azospirillum sp. SYSU D00513 TaxID=2812561 RepID=UPI0020001147|nr:hypothetical protein [Azospirillum sp. SYSU D00513]
MPPARIALLIDGTRLNGATAQEVGVALLTVYRSQRRVQDQGVNRLLRYKTRPSRIPALAPEVGERLVKTRWVKTQALHAPRLFGECDPCLATGLDIAFR